jgi:GTP-binding protein
MKFIDEAKITITSGSGGNGCLSFLREANAPLGGPNGGNGGDGGDIVFQAAKNLNTLVNYQFKRHFSAQNGQGGKGSNRNGKKGEDIILKVPIGTQILTESGKVIIDLSQDQQTINLLEGGKGGLGNAAFKSSQNRAPKIFQKGESGQELIIKLQLKIISDIGIIGFPNSGKSTLLSTISRAKPKIANYPFTTLKPSLGVVYIDEREFVMADIPGLIEGASQGIGLGDRFLKHIERCKLLLHLIDITSPDIIKSYQVIRKELESYSNILNEKSEIIALNKSDLLDPVEAEEISKAVMQKLNLPVITISAATKNNFTSLKRTLLNRL